MPFLACRDNERKNANNEYLTKSHFCTAAEISPHPPVERPFRF
jgi:hypothetical protein